MVESAFIDVEFSQRSKFRQSICGDVFISRRIKEEGRILSVLSDGLGSGVKASVLANLTASMALTFASTTSNTRSWAQSIMASLPVCEVRKLSYSTFTLIDLDEHGLLHFIEYGNPPLILLRGQEQVPVERSEIHLEDVEGERSISYGQCTLHIGDRILCMSDGISQSGMGRGSMPFGWTAEAAAETACSVIQQQPDISSRRLAHALLNQAIANDGGLPRDDSTCAVVHFRVPRQLLIATGPPFLPQRDQELARAVQNFPGKKVICGGTTATIISRLLHRPITVDLTSPDSGLPPSAQMKGIDLITEGALTLANVIKLLESDCPRDQLPENPAGEILKLIMASDIIHFIVGTRINEAHQDPFTPQELDLRRNIVQRIIALLESRHLDTTTIKYL